MMARRWVVALAGLFVTLGLVPPALYATDPELFTDATAVVIIALPFLDAFAASWYSLLWLRHNGTVLGLSALFAWVTTAGLSLVGIPAYRRLVDLPPLDANVLLVGWGVVIVGVGPFLTAVWLIAQRLGSHMDDESPAAIVERAKVAAAEVVDAAEHAARSLREQNAQLGGEEATRLADATERQADATERIADVQAPTDPAADE